MASTSGKVTALAAEFVQRVASGISAAGEVWFGPMQPQAPLAPPDTAGRQFDYQTGYNMQSRPRSSELVGFEQMRALADGYDLLRIIIETRKDQMAKLPWTIKPRDKAGTLNDESAEPDARVDEIISFFKSPDKEHDWSTWLRMLMEEVLVTDAPTVYPRMTKGKQLYAAELVDGATIKRVLDQFGRTPLPPEPAYQQVLKGVTAVNYTRDELIYMPRNPRIHKVYGYSPVEQIITTVNIALRRQSHQLGFYTDGSTPDLIFSVPETWTPDQTKKFEEYWNFLLSGDVRERRRTRFIPSGVTPFDTKDKALKDEYDEWLARVVCFAFSISPQAFVKEMNRATAQTAQESALSEGLAPLMQWVKSLMDSVLARWLNAADLEFKWDLVESVKPKEQAEIDQIYVNAKVMHPDEVRAKRFSLQPMDPALRESLTPKPPMIQQDQGKGEGDKKDDEKPDNTEKVLKSKKSLARIDRDRAVITEATAQLQAELNQFLKAESVNIAEQIITARDQIGKGIKDQVSSLLNSITFGSWTKLVDLFGEKATIVATDGVNQALIQVGVENATEEMLSLVNEKAVNFAKERAAELVGMQIRDGDVVPNPNSSFSVTESTRDMLRADVTQAIEEGWSNDKLADVIQQNYAFSDVRAEAIARTETAIADIEGNMIAYNETGLVAGKEWLTAPDCCPACAALDGMIVPLDGYFVPGSYRKDAPLHPSCRCDMLPVLTEDMPADVKIHDAADTMVIRSNNLLDSVSKGLDKSDLSLGDMAWGKTPVAGLRQSISLFDTLKESGIKPPITWAVHHWSIDSKYISEVMRGADNPKIDPERRDEFSVATSEAIKRLNQLFNRKAAKLVEPVTVYRGVGMSQGKVDEINAALQAGQLFEQIDMSYQSTTIALDLAEDFAARAAKRGEIPVLFVNELQRNTLAVDITQYHYYHPESEVLIGANQRQLITGLYQRDDGVYIMNAIVLPDPDRVKKADGDTQTWVAHYDDPRDESMSGYVVTTRAVNRDDVLSQYPELAGKI